MALFHAVDLWNQYFNALIYISSDHKFPLQLILRQILILQETVADSAVSSAGAAQSFSAQLKTAPLLKYAVIIVSALPLLIACPYLQRFFCTSCINRIRTTIKRTDRILGSSTQKNL